MQEPLKPINEDRRIRELESFEILDTPVQIEYDEITLLASTICKTPIALVSFIDKERQWFKSHLGLDAQETPRDISFCGHAINQNDLFEIKDALKDDRFHDNPLATGEPRVIFYAGQPLISQQGHKLGTLCVIDHEPRELNQSQKDALKVLAKHVITQMEYERANIKLKKSLHKIQSQKEELIESSKMKTLGIMAGGIAHEINNPLCIISLVSQQIKSALEKDKFIKSDLIKHCELVNSTVLRIEDIINALKNISRDSSKDPAQKFELKKTIDEVLMLCNEKAKKAGIDIKVEIESSEDTVFFNCGQLAQVILNLISNSVDAVENLEDRWIKLNVSDEGKFVKISCIDSGSGIETSDADNIMDPFFTTKDPGKGTGLGLSISQKIMTRGNGNLIFDRDSYNTKFDILVPKHDR